MQKLAALWNLFRVGECVDDPAAWKTGQVKATALGAVIMAAVATFQAFNIDLPVDNTSAVAIAGGIIAIVNIVCTYITSDKIGLLPAKSVVYPTAGTDMQAKPVADSAATVGTDSTNGLG